MCRGGFILQMIGGWVRLAKGENRATCVRQHAIHGSIAGQILKCRTIGCGEHNQACVAFLRQGKDFDGRITVSHHRLNLRAATGAGFSGKPAQVLHSG